MPEPSIEDAFGLRGESVAVIGGSSGIGLAAAHLIRAAGANVTIGALADPALERAEHELGFRTRAVDVCDESTVRRFFEGSEQLGHVLVTAAKIAPPAATTDLVVDQQRIALDSRVWGAIHVVKHAIPLLAEHGSITLTSGYIGWKPYPGLAATAASVGAVESLVRTWAVELAPRRVNCLSPGEIDTEINRVVYGEELEDVYRSVAAELPVGRIGRPKDVAQAALFLMANEFVTGIVLPVDGGHRWI